MKEDKWLDGLRDRMKDYSEPVPDNLWADIEKDLEVTPKVIPMRGRWQMVAAVALLLVVSSLTLWFWHSPAVEYMEQQSAKVEEVLPVISEVTPQPLLAEEKKETPSKAIVKRKASDSVFSIIHEGGIYEEMTLVQEEAEKDSVDAPVVVPEEKNEPKEEHPLIRRKALIAENVTTSPKKKSSSLNLGISVGNGLMGSGGISGVSDFMNVQTPEISIPGDSTNHSTDNRKQAALHARSASKISNLDYQALEKKHRIPLVVGVSLRWALNEQWALESGLTYTMLSTDLSLGNQSGEQKLHYVGIPLKVSREVWSDKRWHVYAMAGGAVEKCVYGSLKMNDKWNMSDVNQRLEVDELQWSIQASVGAQYRLAERVGVYVEPGVAYYFDDGSKIETIRKDKPLNFNLQVGLRFTLKK